MQKNYTLPLKYCKCNKSHKKILKVYNYYSDLAFDIKNNYSYEDIERLKIFLINESTYSLGINQAIYAIVDGMYVFITIILAIYSIASTISPDLFHIKFVLFIIALFLIAYAISNINFPRKQAYRYKILYDILNSSTNNIETIMQKKYYRKYKRYHKTQKL